MQALSRKSSREVDRRATAELGIPSLCLMENAGAGAARIAAEILAGRCGPVVCVCGPGGNGGDGMVVARHLAIAGASVRVALVAPPREVRGDAAVQLAICGAIGLRIDELQGPRALEAAPLPALVVDGIYGTGLVRPIDGAAAALVAAINASAATVLSLDLPSGLDCDTGEPLGPCVRADVTATFVAPKLGFSNPRARTWTGEVRVVGIGAPAEWPPRRS